MEWIVQMGFELNIYQADELAGMYWSVTQAHPLLQLLQDRFDSGSGTFSTLPLPGFSTWSVFEPSVFGDWHAI